MYDWNTRFLLFFSFLYLFMLYSFCKCMMIFFFLAFRSLFSLFLSSLSPQFLSLSPSPLANSSFSPLPRPSIPISLKYRQLRQQKYNPPSPLPPVAISTAVSSPSGGGWRVGDDGGREERRRRGEGEKGVKKGKSREQLSISRGCGMRQGEGVKGEGER